MKLDAYEQLIKGYAIEIVRWLVSKKIPADKAEDVVQDVFVKMLELDVLIAPENLRAWMYRVSLRTYINKYKRDKRYHEILQEMSADEVTVTLADELPDMGEFLLKLAPADRKLLHAYYYEDLSIKELSAATQKSQSAVKIRLYRARKKLQKILEEEGFTK
ncbi:MAG: RNA polymerase sigma factor [Streptococcaceae bacterium]|jgi:RNA polymerase sigma-70 factor (ECF subfamily)|nr:RNA polymerase sigma factor [Streptococcaceae bacterium]